jgi:NAD(P)H-nitrite reductase large subunit
MVVVGIGVKPNIELVNQSGIKVNRGILVDDMMRTNFSNIFAAGDVTEGENIVTGKMEVMPNWSNACKQGRIAGLNMVGCQQRFEGGLKETITTIFGLTVVSIGVSKASEGGGLTEPKFFDPEGKRYRKILLSDNRIVGAVLLERAGDAGILKNLIRNKKDISVWRDAMVRTPLDMRKLVCSIINP